MLIDICIVNPDVKAIDPERISFSRFSTSADSPGALIKFTSDYNIVNSRRYIFC